VCGQRHTPAALPPGKDPDTHYAGGIVSSRKSYSTQRYKIAHFVQPSWVGAYPVCAQGREQVVPEHWDHFLYTRWQRVQEGSSLKLKHNLQMDCSTMSVSSANWSFASFMARFLYFIVTTSMTLNMHRALNCVTVQLNMSLPCLCCPSASSVVCFFVEVFG